MIKANEGPSEVEALRKNISAQAKQVVALQHDLTGPSCAIVAVSQDFFNGSAQGRGDVLCVVALST